MEEKKEARIKDKKIQELVRLPADSKFKNLSACWRIPEIVRLLADFGTCLTTGKTCPAPDGTCPPTGGL